MLKPGKFLPTLLEVTTVHPEKIKKCVGFQFRSANFLVRSRKSMGCAEAYENMSHKQIRRLTQILWKRTISEWKRTRDTLETLFPPTSNFSKILK